MGTSFHSSQHRRTMLVVKNATAIVIALVVVTGAYGQESPFRWLSKRSDRTTFRQIEAALANELAPDRAQPGQVPMSFKFIDRVGIRDTTALVIIGEREGETSPYTVYHAMNLDLRTKAKSPIRAKGVEWLWMWHVEKVTHLTSPTATDVVFTFLTCTECESERVLSAFHYDPKMQRWSLQQWGREDAGILVASDPQYVDNGAYLYDCLHAVADVTADGLDDVAVRCREWLQADLEKAQKRITKDETLLYAAVNGKLTRNVVNKTTPRRTVIKATLCATKPRSPLCRSR